MRNTNKKGFTIVELAIVVAVIAILAAVLIPTFSGVIHNARTANDTVVAKNMNVALAEYSAINGNPENFDEVLEAIESAGYVLANLNAKASGNLYGWDKANNQIVYISADGETLYKNVDFVAADLRFVVANSDVQVPTGFGTPVDMTKPEGPKALKQALANGGVVNVVDDIFVTDESNGAKNLITSNTTINFGDNVINLDLPNATAATSNYNALRIENGTVVLDGNNGGLVTADNGELYALTVNASASGDSAHVTIKGGKYIGGTTAVNVVYGTVIIAGGFFENQTGNAKYVINAKDTNWKDGTCDIQIKGGTFVNFDPSANCESANPNGRTNYLADGYKVVSETQANGDVWYTVVAE